MNINLQISQTSITEDFVVKAYEVQNDGSLSEVASISVPAPHSTPEWVAFTGLDKVTHTIKVIGATSTIEYNNYEKTPSVDTVTLFDFIQFKIGDGGTYTPAADTNVYANPYMAGMAANEYLVCREVKGFLIEGLQIANEPTGGGFSLLGGSLFEDGEQITILPKPKVVRTPVNDSVVGKQFGPTIGNANMFVDVTSTLSYVPTHLRKLIRLAGVNANYKFTSANVPPLGYIFRITNFGSYGAVSPLPKVTFENAPAKYGNTTVTTVSIPFAQVIECVWDGTQWNLSLSFPLTATLPTYAKGVKVVGDVSGAGTTVTIGAGDGLPTQTNANYHISFQIVSNGVPFNDNTIIASVIASTKTTTQFQLILGEARTIVQNVSIDWCVINF